MVELSSDKLLHVELSFFGLLKAQFQKVYPQALVGLIASKYGHLNVFTLSAAARSLLSGPPPSAPDCLRACAEEAAKACRRANALTAKDIYREFPGLPCVIDRETPEGRGWTAILRRLGMDYFDWDTGRGKITVPCRDPREFLATCSAAGVPVDDLVKQLFDC